MTCNQYLAGRVRNNLCFAFHFHDAEVSRSSSTVNVKVSPELFGTHGRTFRCQPKESFDQGEGQCIRYRSVYFDQCQKVGRMFLVVFFKGAGLIEDHHTALPDSLPYASSLLVVEY